MGKARRPGQRPPVRGGAAVTRMRGGAGVTRETDPLVGELAEVRFVQPYAATKLYRCPSCNQEIGIGIGHVVVVPLSQTDERRHWHRGCWDARGSRPPGR